MILGYILYDVGINIIKYSYSGIRGLYYWYYEDDTPEKKREKQLLKEIELLTKKLEIQTKLIQGSSCKML